ncbi:MAG: hypothetical protein C5B55_11705 [Blastocatellia bacterium]|nr:MAG: hypothetical protein C5B55_11705 [Blastocatellia bacterium]
MTNLRSHIDPDRSTAPAPTQFKTAQNDHPVRCSVCGETFFVTDQIYQFAKEGIEAGLDNPFQCPACEEESDEYSYDG